MLFGLKKSPAMDRFRIGLGKRQVFTYMDDILVISETFEQHLSDVQVIFDRLTLFNLRARRDKCNFFRKIVKCLEHISSAKGIEVDPEKTSAIIEMKFPTSAKEVHSFVQMSS